MPDSGASNLDHSQFWAEGKASLPGQHGWGYRRCMHRSLGGDLGACTNARQAAAGLLGSASDTLLHPASELRVL